MKHHRPESLINRGIRTQEQVARMLGVTRGTVSLYETSALRKMRERLADLAPGSDLAPGTEPAPISPIRPIGPTHHSRPRKQHP